jgi:hypothetical protein
MKSNVGKTDAIMRVLAGLVMAGLGVYYNSWWGFAALIPFVTAFTGFCPLYKLAGINTCKPKRRKIKVQ